MVRVLVAPLAALLDFGHNSDLCGRAGHSSIKYIYHFYHSVGTGSYIYDFPLALPSFLYQGGPF